MIGLGPRSEVPILKQVEELHHGNMTALPEPGTLHAIPWAGAGKYNVGEVLCETHWIQSKEYQEACPRTVARRQLEKLDKLGYSFYSGFEVEFKLLDGKSGAPVFDGCDALNQLIVAQHEEFLFDVDQRMIDIGIDIQKIHTEYSPGQFEIGLHPQTGIKAVDDFFLLKYGLKELALRQGMEANFMTMSNPHEGCGNAAHYNHSLWTKAGDSAFYDCNKPDNLSDVARYWIGGLIKHANALTALCSPTVNCYRRLHQIWIPDTISWGIDDRTSCFRVKNYSPKSTYIENRMASSTCNPYIVLAANVAAGLDGIINKIECPSKSQPKDTIPFTLQEAIKALEEDVVLVEALGKEFIHWYCETKKQIDFKKLEKSDVKVNNFEEINAEVALYGKYM